MWAGRKLLHRGHVLGKKVCKLTQDFRAPTLQDISDGLEGAALNLHSQGQC